MSDASINASTLRDDEAGFGDYFALLKPRVMSLVVFTALVGLLAAPVPVHPMIGFCAILFIAIGGGASGALRLRSGDPSRGAFLHPVLLRCHHPMEAQDTHQLCVRGPTATILAYDDLCEALALASKNPGSCGAAVFTEDAATAQHAAACLAAFGGAIRIRSTAAAADPADGPADGTEAACPALPQEQDVLELMRPFLRATALKGPPQLLTAVTGQWIEGAAADTGEHPFRKPLSRLRPGDQLITRAREITLEEVEQFAHLTGDVFYAHMDDTAARAHPFFSRRVAHGQLVVAFANGLFVDPEPGPMLANMGSDNLRFHLPVYFGDRLHVRLTCKRVSPPSGAGFGEVTWDCAVFANDGQLAASYDLLTLVAVQWPQPNETSA